MLVIGLIFYMLYIDIFKQYNSNNITFQRLSHHSLGPRTVGFFWVVSAYEPLRPLRIAAREKDYVNLKPEAGERRDFRENYKHECPQSIQTWMLRDCREARRVKITRIKRSLTRFFVRYKRSFFATSDSVQPQIQLRPLAETKKSHRNWAELSRQNPALRKNSEKKNYKEP